jgi:hypothetical protein
VWVPSPYAGQYSTGGLMTSFWKLVVLGIVVVAAAMVLFGVIHFLAGLIWFFIKLVVIVAVLYFLVRWAIRKVEHTSK